MLGSVLLTPSTTGNEGGTASLKAAAPSGLTGASKVGAFYGGDVNYLSSWSALSAVTAKPTLVICPTTITMAPGQTGLTFQTTGGAPPISLTIAEDTTCTFANHKAACSTLDDAGVFTAGPMAGTAIVTAIDQDEAYVNATVTVAGTPVDGGSPPQFSCNPDAGVSDAGSSDAALDATTHPTGSDAAVDGGKEPEASKGGCGCVAAGESGGMAVAGWGGVMVGLAAFCTRRRRGSHLNVRRK